MKIKHLFEGYYKNLDIERQERREDVPTSAPKKPTSENYKFHIAIWYDRTGYLVTTVAPTQRKAESQALYRVKQYIKANYPRYDITGLLKSNVAIEVVPEDQYKAKAARLVVI